MCRTRISFPKRPIHSLFGTLKEHHVQKGTTPDADYASLRRLINEKNCVSGNDTVRTLLRKKSHIVSNNQYAEGLLNTIQDIYKTKKRMHNERLQTDALKAWSPTAKPYYRRPIYSIFNDIKEHHVKNGTSPDADYASLRMLLNDKDKIVSGKDMILFLLQKKEEVIAKHPYAKDVVRIVENIYYKEQKESEPVPRKETKETGTTTRITTTTIPKPNSLLEQIIFLLINRRPTILV